MSNNLRFSTSADEVAEVFSDHIKGKTILITGASLGGLGAKAAQVIAKHGPGLKQSVPGANKAIRLTQPKHKNIFKSAQLISQRHREQPAYHTFHIRKIKKLGKFLFCGRLSSTFKSKTCNWTRKKRKRRKRKRKAQQQRQAQEGISAVRTTVNLQGPGHTQWVPEPYTPSAKFPLIVFGDAMFGRKNAIHFSGHRHGLVDVLWKALKRRERQGHLLAITIDEYLTSQICNNCQCRTLEKVTTADNISHHSILYCNRCNILWQRDINASKNMFQIATTIWCAGVRPSPFRRSPAALLPQTTAIAVENAVSLPLGSD